MTRILYIEDNEDNVYMLVRRLSRRGFDVQVAGDGAEGLKAAAARDPDLILMDLSLPIIDGWEATKRLKGSVETKDIPVICLSAHAMEGDRDQALAAGCDEYDTKPVNFEELVLKIDRLLGVKTK